MMTRPTNKKSDLGKWIWGIDSAVIRRALAVDIKFLQNQILKMGVMTRCTSPKRHRHPQIPVESLNLMSKLFPLQQRTRSQIRRRLRSVRKWSLMHILTSQPDCYPCIWWYWHHNWGSSSFQSCPSKPLEGFSALHPRYDLSGPFPFFCGQFPLKRESCL